METNKARSKHDLPITERRPCYLCHFRLRVSNRAENASYLDGCSKVVQWCVLRIHDASQHQCWRLLCSEYKAKCSFVASHCYNILSTSCVPFCSSQSCCDHDSLSQLVLLCDNTNRGTVADFQTDIQDSETMMTACCCWRNPLHSSACGDGIAVKCQCCTARDLTGLHCQITLHHGVAVA